MPRSKFTKGVCGSVSKCVYELQCLIWFLIIILYSVGRLKKKKKHMKKNVTALFPIRLCSSMKKWYLQVKINISYHAISSGIWHTCRVLACNMAQGLSKCINSFLTSTDLPKEKGMFLYICLQVRSERAACQNFSSLDNMSHHAL